MSEKFVVIGDGQMAKMICSFPNIVGYVKPHNFREIFNIQGKNIGKTNKKIHIGIIGMADTKYKKESTDKWLSAGFSLGVLIHPTATIFGKPRIGGGTVVFPYVFIDNESSIGKSCYIGSHTAVHKSKVENFVHVTFGCQIIMSKVKDGVVLGSNSTVLENRTVGKNSIIGAGAVVYNNVPDNHKLIQEVVDKLVPIDNFDWTEDNFNRKNKPRYN